MDVVTDRSATLALSSALPALSGSPLSEAWEPDVEAELVARAKRDRRAFAAIYRAHYVDVVRYLFRRVGHEQTAEDLATETFLKAMRNVKRYESRGLPIRAWLLRIATNEAHRWARRQGRRRVASLSAEHAATVRAGETARGIEQEDGVRVVLDALLALSADHQDVLALHHLEGLDVAQVALVLGCRVGTVKSRLARARDGLRRELERRRFIHA